MLYQEQPEKGEKLMEEKKDRSGFRWRWVAAAVLTVTIIASMLSVGIVAYNVGHEHGYKQLEKELVYAIAIHNSKRVGNFLVAKVDNGGTIIALNESSQEEDVSGDLIK